LDTHTSTNAPDLRDYLRPILSRLPLVLALVVVVTGATYFYYDRKPDVYASSTRLMVAGSEVDRLLMGREGGTRDRNAVANLSVLIQTEPVARVAAKRLDYRGDPRALLGAIEVGSEKESDFIAITSTAGDPEVAARVANAFARAFITVTTEDRRRAAGLAVESLQEQIEALGTGLENTDRRAEMRERLEELRSVADLPAYAVGTRQLDKAVPISVPIEPKPMRNAIFAFVVSLMLAIAGAFGLERLDRRLRRPEDVEGLYPVPNLAELPGTSHPDETEDGAALLPRAFREPLRMLRTNLDLASLDGQLRTLLVTSAGPREGKSTVVRNLALAYRESGANVAIIDADLRRPSMNRVLPVEREPGLIDVLTGRESLEGALQTADVHVEDMDTLMRLYSQNGSGNGNGKGHVDMGQLAVLAAGATPANPPAVLAAERMRRLLHGVADRFDIVLVDTPPMLAFGDAVPLMSEVDGVILVARLGTTTSDAARRLMTRLERIPNANILGVVANDVGKRAQAQRSYAYHYGYYARA
jgi:succinoglycan biosynthesis transport protein ExoP